MGEKQEYQRPLPNMQISTDHALLAIGQQMLLGAIELARPTREIHPLETSQRVVFAGAHAGKRILMKTMGVLQ